MSREFRLGRHLVNPRAATIQADGRRQRIDRMAMRVLEYLAERAGQEVTRREIVDVVWEGRAISDEALTVAISTLRKSLGDDARTPRYIETIPKYGYRLIAPVAAEISDWEAASPGIQSPPTSAPRRHVWAWGLAAIVILIALVVWISGGPALVRATRDPGGFGGIDSPSKARPSMPHDPMAHRAFLRGSYLLEKESLDALTRSIPELEDAIRHESSFAPAHAALAEAHILLAERGAMPPSQAFDVARAEIDTALRIDDSARAHALQAITLFAYEWDFDAAEAEFLRALALDPADARARGWYAQYLTALGKFDRAIDQIERQREIDPRAYSRPHAATVFNMARRHDRALRELREQIEIEPGSAELRFELAQTYIHLGQPHRAVEEVLAFPALQCDDPEEMRRRLEQESGACGLCRLRLEWLQGAQQDGAPVTAVDFAEAYAGIGDTESAIQWLERAADQREPRLLDIGFDPKFDTLRDDPRFGRLVARVGLPRPIPN